MTAPILIDPELENLLTPLGGAEAALLESSLRREGCRDPLTVWAETGLLLDGHHRHRVCTAHTIPFRVTGYRSRTAGRRSSGGWPTSWSEETSHLSRRAITGGSCSSRSSGRGAGPTSRP